MKQILKNIILENQALEFPLIIPRQIQVPDNLPVIITLTGVRRSGKTYILYDLIQNLIKQGIRREHILYINFEDERLTLESNTLDLIIQAWSELFPGIDMKNLYLFFDEVQNIRGWQKFVRRIFDTTTRHIFITGSNSKLLSSEIATELRGRTLSFNIFPLSFSEYLDFKKNSKKLYPLREKSRIIHHAGEFLTGGGFPETISFDSKNRTRLLQQYFNVMIFRDIVERYQIPDIDVLKFFIKKIFASVTKPFSINKAYNDLRSMGYKISNKYLYNYFDYCNDIFLCQSISKFNFSEIKQAKSEKKAYIIDTGLLSAIEFSLSQNAGKLLENMVFLEFLKKEREVFYYKERYECDFVVKTENQTEAFQVCYDIADEETLNREVKGLTEACDYLGISQGTILTFDTEKTMDYNKLKIEIIPAYKYFLK